MPQTGEERLRSSSGLMAIGSVSRLRVGSEPGRGQGPRNSPFLTGLPSVITRQDALPCSSCLPMPCLLPPAVTLRLTAPYSPSPAVINTADCSVGGLGDSPSVCPGHDLQAAVAVCPCVGGGEDDEHS